MNETGRNVYIYIYNYILFPCMSFVVVVVVTLLYFLYKFKYNLYSTHINLYINFTFSKDQIKWITSI